MRCSRSARAAGGSSFSGGEGSSRDMTTEGGRVPCAAMDCLSTMTYERTGKGARITLNRPERGNGITLDLPRELAACVERANLDPEVHVLALAGNGKGFCGGHDLVASAEGGEGGVRGNRAPEGSPLA